MGHVLRAAFLLAGEAKILAARVEGGSVSVKGKHHLARVRSLPCLICEMCGLGDTPAEAHHVFDSAARSDFLTVSLCHVHHRGALGFHGLGERAFNAKYKTSEAELLAMTIERLS
jgi:hypothetical protein